MLRFFTVVAYSRSFRTLIPVCALLPWVWIAPLVSQAPTEFQDVLPELAARIVALVKSDSEVSLAASAPDSTSSAARRLQEAMAMLLASHRVRVVDPGDGLTSVDVSCSANLRERSCVAEVQNDTRRDVVIVSRRHDGAPQSDNRSPVTLELRSLVSQQTAILDVANLGDRLLLLDATAVTLYRQGGQGWQPMSSRPLPIAHVWPRDLRGRLRVDEDRFGVFLPGVACAGRLDQLTLECAESRQPWPLGIENSGLDPTRNYFSTPEGLQFYNVAALGADADARWLIAERSGTLSLLDGSRRVLASVAIAEDVAGIAAPCAPESYVVAAELSGGREAVRLFQVVRQRLVAIASPIFVTGTLTALWAAPGATSAIAIAHDTSGGRYEAFLATLSCGR